MLVNLIVIFLILFIGFLYKRIYGEFSDTDAIRKRYVRIICFILILQSGLRNVAVGADTYAYFLKFEEIKLFSWKAIILSFEEYYRYGIGKSPGYLVFQKIVHYFSDEYQVFLFIIAILFFVALGFFLYKNTNRITDLILAFVIYSVLFYPFFSITGHKQTIATVCTLYGFELIKKRKLILFVAIILLASTIHKSSFIFLPFYLTTYIRNPIWIYRSVLILFPLFFIYKNSLASYFKVIGGYEEYDQYEGAGTFVFTTMFLLIAAAALLRSKKVIKGNPDTRYYFMAFGVALLFVPLTWVNPSAMRVVQYFSIFMLLLIPEIIHSLSYISVKIRNEVLILFVFLLLALFVRSSLGSSYGFFWEEMSLGENYR